MDTGRDGERRVRGVTRKGRQGRRRVRTCKGDASDGRVSGLVFEYADTRVFDFGRWIRAGDGEWRVRS